MKIFIPSYNRARCVFALGIFPSATVIVPASQADLYQRGNAGLTMQSIADDQDGNLARKRNLLAAQGAQETDGAFVMVDDDVAGLWDRVEGRAIAGDEAVAVLEALAVRAQTEGAAAFGVGPSRLLPWNPAAEWVVGGVFHHLYGFRALGAAPFDEAVAGLECTDFFLQCRQRGWKTLRWDRYALDVLKGNLGGLDRAKTNCVDACTALARKWGPQVVDLTPEGVLCGLNFNAVQPLPA